MMSYTPPPYASLPPQMAYGAMPEYGIPMAMGQQPVYFSSMSQLPPGAVPVSQGMLAHALGHAQVSAGVVQPEQSSPISRVLKGAGIGAAAGAAFGIIPFLPLGLISGALVGAGVGAAIALLRKPRRPEGEFHTMTPAQQAAIAQAQMVASTPPGARSVATTGDATVAPVREKVVMGPAMRRRWAAKVRAERAEAAALATPPVPASKGTRAAAKPKA
jgi:hypothetical protein